MNNTDTMKQVHLLAQEHCGLKVGDWVRVTRKAEDYEGGWDNTWLEAKDDLVGKVYQISTINKFGVWIAPSNKTVAIYSVPYFVLEKVEKPVHKFKPFDKVLVRDSSKENWRCNIFSHWVGGDYPYYCIKNPYRYCIPYEGNEHLIGTTGEPNG